MLHPFETKPLTPQEQEQQKNIQERGSGERALAENQKASLLWQQKLEEAKQKNDLIAAKKALEALAKLKVDRSKITEARL